MIWRCKGGLKFVLLERKRRELSFTSGMLSQHGWSTAPWHRQRRLRSQNLIYLDDATAVNGLHWIVLVSAWAFSRLLMTLSLPCVYKREPWSHQCFAMLFIFRVSMSSLNRRTPIQSSVTIHDFFPSSYTVGSVVASMGRALSRERTTRHAPPQRWRI